MTTFQNLFLAKPNGPQANRFLWPACVGGTYQGDFAAQPPESCLGVAEQHCHSAEIFVSQQKSWRKKMEKG